MNRNQGTTLLKRIVLDAELDHCIANGLTVTVNREGYIFEGKIDAYSDDSVSIDGERYAREGCTIRFPFLAT
ncbi:hypothetical protein MO973_02955 [Paenibacillus sp. TRM 82003]|nr:hypothetical protein [Paenibacillus sp. TRM 82003]